MRPSRDDDNPSRSSRGMKGASARPREAGEGIPSTRCDEFSARERRRPTSENTAGARPRDEARAECARDASSERPPRPTKSLRSTEAPWTRCVARSARDDVSESRQRTCDAPRDVELDGTGTSASLAVLAAWPRRRELGGNPVEPATEGPFGKEGASDVALPPSDTTLKATSGARASAALDRRAPSLV